MDQAYAEIASALENYFDGFYTGDTDQLRGIFHANCHLFTAADGPL